MKKLLIFFTLLFSLAGTAQKVVLMNGWKRAAGGGGGGLTIATVDTKVGSAASTHSLTSVPAGALLVVTTTDENHSGNAALTSSPSLTWTKQVDATASNGGDAEIWTAVFTAGGTISVTSTWCGGTCYQSSVCYVVTGQESTLGGASATATNQNTISVGLTSTRVNSILFMVTSDYGANDGASRAYRDGATERLYAYSAPNATYYHYTKSAATITTYTEGLTSPVLIAANGNTAILEIRTP